MYTTSITLLERLRESGDRVAWNRFVVLYSPFLLSCCRRRGLDRQESIDALQDVFLLLVRKLPDFRYAKDGSFRSWLRTVTTRKCLEQLRRRTVPTIPLSGSEIVEVADPHNPQDEWDSEDLQLLMNSALDLIKTEFKPTTWQAFWKTTVEDCSTGEVAKELGISVNAVFIARARVLRRLRAELGDFFED